MYLADRPRGFRLKGIMTTTQVAQRSEALFQQGFCCAESVLQAIAESRGIQSELIPRIATGLCGGIAKTGGVCGNSDIQVWETGDREAIRREVLRKLKAAKGGGMIFQSDYSVSSSVSGPTYDYLVKLVREHGRYPLQLDETNL